MGQLETQRFHERIAKILVHNENTDNTTTTEEQYGANPDENLVVLLRRFGGNRHFIHDFFSL